VIYFYYLFFFVTPHLYLRHITYKNYDVVLYYYFYFIFFFIFFVIPTLLFTSYYTQKRIQIMAMIIQSITHTFNIITNIAVHFKRVI